MRHSLLFVIIVLFLLCGCQEEEVKHTPTKLLAAGATQLFAYQNEITMTPAAVQVLDENANPLAGAAVQFFIVEGSAALDAENVITDVNGTAFTYPLFQNTSDSVVVVEARAAAIDQPIRFTFKISKSRATRVTVKSGANQIGPRGALLPKEIEIRVTDNYSNPAYNVSATFLVLAGDGHFTSTTVSTNEQGFADNTFHLATDRAVNKVAVAIAGDTAFFNLYGNLKSEILSLSKTSDGIDIVWEKSENFSFQNYLIQRTYSISPSSFETIAAITDVNVTTYRDADAVPGATYLYKVVTTTKEEVSLTSDNKSIDFGDFIEMETADIEIDDERNLLYASIRETNTVRVIDLNTKQVKKEVFIGSQPLGISISKDNSTLYVALSGSGNVAFLDLETYVVKTISVKSEVAAVTVSDVMEAAPGLVFVVASSSNPSALAVIKTAENNKVERFAPIGIGLRGDHRLQVDYGNALYIFNGSNFTTVSPLSDYANATVKTDNSIYTESNTFAINAAQNQLYITTAAYHLPLPLSLVRRFEVGGPVVSADGSVVHYIGYHSIDTYRTPDLQLLKTRKIASGSTAPCKVTSDNKLLVVRSSLWSRKSILLFIENN